VPCYICGNLAGHIHYLHIVPFKYEALQL
jgi:hypothetical protein